MRMLSRCLLPLALLLSLPVLAEDTKPSFKLEGHELVLPSTPEGKAKNRRVAFFNAALRDRPIGGMPVDGGGKLAGDPCAKK